MILQIAQQKYDDKADLRETNTVLDPSSKSPEQNNKWATPMKTKKRMKQSKN